MRKFYEAAIIFIGTLGWWGFVYPELSAVTEVCVQETDEESHTDEGGGQEADEGNRAGKGIAARAEENSFFREICETLGDTGVKSGNVRIKSRIAEYLYQGKEKDRSEKESDYE